MIALDKNCMIMQEYGYYFKIIQYLMRKKKKQKKVIKNDINLSVILLIYYLIKSTNKNVENCQSYQLYRVGFHISSCWLTAIIRSYCMENC